MGYFTNRLDLIACLYNKVDDHEDFPVKVNPYAEDHVLDIMQHRFTLEEAVRLCLVSRALRKDLHAMRSTISKILDETSENA